MFRVTARRKALGRLRENDYKKYEWLLEKLNLLYKPQPHDAPDGVVVPRKLVARKVRIETLDILSKGTLCPLVPALDNQFLDKIMLLTTSYCG